MTLEEAISHAEEKAKGCSACAIEHRQLAEWLKKLKNVQNVLPRPVVRDGNGKLAKDYSSRDWYLKLQEEIFELNRAFMLQSVNWGGVFDVGEDIADVITVCISWLETLGYDEEKRSELFAAVNEKNEKRGYFRNS